MKLKIDFRKEIGSLAHFWRSTGFSPADLMLTKDMQQQMTYTGAIPHGGITYVRIHFLLELVKGSDLLGVNPVYDWELLDIALDLLARNRTIPIFEVMGNPQNAWSDFNDLAQLLAWKRLVKALAEHCMERYGRENVERWYFESWNEPDGGWWHQWPHDEGSFCNYYDATSEGLREANPALILGGPGSCRTLSSLFRTFIAHCDSGRNVLTGETGVRLDFISIHEKGVRQSKEDINPNTLALLEREIKIVAYIRQHHPRFAQTPFMNNECDPQVGWWHTHTWHARPYYAAIICRIINQHLLGLIDGLDVPFTILSNDHGFIGEWGNRTLLARFGAKPSDDNGQSRHKNRIDQIGKDYQSPPFEMIKKPGMNVMALLALLGDRRVMVTPPGSPEDEVGVIATLRGETQAAVLVYHSRDRIMSSGVETIRLNLHGLPFEKAMLAHYRIDEDHGDPFTAWEAAGAPEMPSAEVLKAMRLRQELELLDDPEEVYPENGSLELEFDLPLHSVSLLLFSADPQQPPERVEQVWLETYQGITDEQQVMVAWKGLPSRLLRTYEVLCAPQPQGPFTRVNEPDLVSTAFLHVSPPGPKFYRVRAVDYWGRAGEESETVGL